MAYVPKAKNLTATSPEVVNAIRSDNPGNYQSMVPLAVTPGQQISDGAGGTRTATREDAIISMRAVGNVINQYTPLKNAFLSTLYNRIVREIIISRMYQNPLKLFEKGMMEMGDTIEEIFIAIANPHIYNPEEAENKMLKREIPDVKTAFHCLNYQVFYKATTQNYDLRQAFLSLEGVTSMVEGIITQLYTAANFDEYITTKYMIARAALEGNIYPKSITAVTDSATANKAVIDIKQLSDDFTFMSDLYNEEKVLNYSDKSHHVLLINTAYNAQIDVHSLAALYNEQYAEFMGRVILFDHFSPTAQEQARLDTLLGSNPGYSTFTAQEKQALDKIPMLLVDDRWFMIYSALELSDDFRNGEGLYWNHWLHVWKWYSYSPFTNAALFTTETSAVQTVTVSPATASITGGMCGQFKATVATTGFADKDVTWSVYGNITHESVKATVDENGNVCLASDIADATVTVKATSKADPNKNGTATVTVVEPT